MNSKQIGDLSELKIMARIVELGMTVCTPHGDRARYDMIMDDNGTLSRLQVKTARLLPGGILFIKAYSSHKHPVTRKWINKNYHTEVEYIAAYSHELDQCFLLPLEILKKQGQLRLLIETPKKRRQNSHYATDFIF